MSLTPTSSSLIFFTFFFFFTDAVETVKSDSKLQIHEETSRGGEAAAHVASNGTWLLASGANTKLTGR